MVMNLFRLLREQAYSRSDFMLTVRSYSKEIMTNICLIAYARTFSPDREHLVPHWAEELTGYCEDIGYDILKGNNSVKARINALVQELVKNGEWASNTQMVMNKLRRKFKIEGIPIDDRFEASTKHGMEILPDLIEVLADYSEDKMERFIRNI